MTFALAVLSPLVFLALLEGIAKLCGVQPLRQDPGYLARVKMRECQFSWSQPRKLCPPQRIASPRPRVVVTLGGSSVQGVPVGRVVPFATHLQGLLDAAHPNEYAVFNLGLMCKDSTYVRRCVEQLIGAAPEFLIVYSGHNSYANWGFENPAARIFLAEHAWLYDLDWFFMGSRILSLWARAAGSLMTSPLMGEAEPPPEQFARARATILAHYTSDITSLLDLAGENASQVILLTVVSNLYEYPLRRAQWNQPGLGSTRWGPAFSEGVDLYRAGRFAEALAAFKRARDAFPQGRAPSELNQRVRELAQGRPYVHLADFERELDQIGLEDGIGCNFFGDETYCDQFHPNTRTHRLIAAALFREMEELRRAGIPPARTGKGERP